MCKESDYPNQCGANYQASPVRLPTIQCNEACVTFKNIYDGGLYYRNCSSGIWLPPTGKYDTAVHGSVFADNNCIKDRYSGELFCYCFGNSCNGYNTGIMSVFNINECASNPCLNGGKCEDMYNKFRCHCPNNFAGPTCAIKYCDNSTCSNNGICIDNGNSFSCQCHYTHYGDKCEHLRSCFSHTCRNGGMCSHDPTNPAGYYCTCQQGWGGMNCETRIGCGANTCSVNGRCVTETNGGFRCECPPSFIPESFCAERDYNVLCKSVGLTHDPVYCQSYVECTQDANGKLIGTARNCVSPNGMAHWFDKINKTCYQVRVNEACVKDQW